MWFQQASHNLKCDPTVEEFTPKSGPPRTMAIVRLGDQADLTICLSWAELTDLSDAINTAIIRHAKDIQGPTIVTEPLFNA